MISNKLEKIENDLISIILNNNIKKLKNKINENNYLLTYNNNFIFRYAIRAGSFNIIELLLKQPAIDPSVFNNCCIIHLYYDYSNKNNDNLNIIYKIWNNKKVKETLLFDDKYIYDQLKKIDLKNNIKQF